jgi:hypothetical protein
MKRLLMLTLALFTGAIFAGTATLNWVAPTTRTDGSEITGTLSYKVYGALQGATKALIGTATTTTFVHSGATGGQTWCYAATAVETVGTTASPESVPSNEACKAIPISPPNPPSGLVVTSVVAYRVIQLPHLAYLRRVGTVPLGTQCGVESAVDGYYLIDRKDIKFLRGRSKRGTFAALCG